MLSNFTLSCNADDYDKIHVNAMHGGWDDLGTSRENDCVEIEIENKSLDSNRSCCVVLSVNDTNKLIKELKRIMSNEVNSR